MNHYQHSFANLWQRYIIDSFTVPPDTSLGPYSGHHVSKDQIDEAEHNQWLWEVCIKAAGCVAFTNSMMM